MALTPYQQALTNHLQAVKRLSNQNACRNIEIAEIERKHKANVDRAQAEVDAAAEEVRVAREKLLVELMKHGLIDFLAPTHGRTSCSDENPCNEHRGCVRCKFLMGQVYDLSKMHFDQRV